MASSTFVLKEPNTDKKTLIFLIGRFNNRRIKYSIGFSIRPNHWDKEDQEAIVKNSHPQFKKLKIKLSKEEEIQNSTINLQIGRYKEAWSNIFNYLTHNKIVPRADILIKKLDEEFKLNPFKSTERTTFNIFIIDYIKRMENGLVITDHGKQLTPGTIKNYKTFNSQFLLFQKEKHRIIDFDDVTIDFYDDFIEFFNKKNYSPNTIGRHIRTLKTLMKVSKEMGLHKNTETERKRFKTINVNTDTIYLTNEEITRMHNLDLSNNKPLELARDVFIIGCYTGLRYSDYSRIEKSHIKTTNKKRVIDLVTKKTGERVIIPCHPRLIEILEKYNYNIPKTYEQKVNKRIKDVGKIVKINEDVRVEAIKGGLKVVTTYKKYKLIQTHTARRSAATNMYKSGIPVIDIMKITGHKTESAFMRYIRITKEENANRLAKHSFFNQQTKMKVI